MTLRNFPPFLLVKPHFTWSDKQAVDTSKTVDFRSPPTLNERSMSQNGTYAWPMNLLVEISTNVQTLTSWLCASNGTKKSNLTIEYS